MDSYSNESESVQAVTEGTVPAESYAPQPALVPPAPVYGAPQPYDVAMTGFAPAPPAPRNVLALLGVIFAVLVWPVGLILSTLGLFNAINRRTGKVLAVIGLVLSIAVGGAVVAVLHVATSTVASSPALDPGCGTIEAKLTSDMAFLKTDTTTLESNEDSATSSTTSIDTVNTDLTTIESDVTTASGQATHADVKNDLNTMNTQIQPVGKALSDVENHSTSSEGAAAAALTTLQSTDSQLDALCATY